MNLEQVLNSIYSFLYPDCGERAAAPAPSISVEPSIAPAPYQSADQFLNRFHPYLGNDALQMLDDLRQRNDARWPALHSTLETYLRRQERLNEYHWNSSQMPFRNFGFYLNEFSFDIYVRLNEVLGVPPYELRPDINLLISGSENEYDAANSRHRLQGRASLTSTFLEGETTYGVGVAIQNRRLQTSISLAENQLNAWLRSKLLEEFPVGYRSRDGFALSLGASRFYSGVEKRNLDVFRNIAQDLEENFFQSPLELDLLTASMLEFLNREQHSTPIPVIPLFESLPLENSSRSLSVYSNSWRDFIRENYPQDLKFYEVDKLNLFPGTSFPALGLQLSSSLILSSERRELSENSEPLLRELHIESEISPQYLVLGPDFFILSPAQNTLRLDARFDPSNFLSTLNLEGHGDYLWQAIHLPGNIRLGEGHIRYVGSSLGLDFRIPSFNLNMEPSPLTTPYSIEALHLSEGIAQQISNLNFLPGLELRRVSSCPLVFEVKLNVNFKVNFHTPQGELQVSGHLVLLTSLLQSQSTSEWNIEAGHNIMQLSDLEVSVGERSEISGASMTLSDYAPYGPQAFSGRSGFSISTRSAQESGEGFVGLQRDPETSSYNLAQSLENFSAYFSSTRFRSTHPRLSFYLNTALKNNCRRESTLNWNFDHLPFAPLLRNTFASYLQSSRGQLSLRHELSAGAQSNFQATVSGSAQLRPSVYDKIRDFIPGIDASLNAGRSLNVALSRGRLSYQEGVLRSDLRASASLLAASRYFPLIHSLDLSLRGSRGQCLLNSWLSSDLRGMQQIFTLSEGVRQVYHPQYTRNFSLTQAQVPFACAFTRRQP